MSDPQTHQPPASDPASLPMEADGTKPVSELSPEEQLALFEKELKENDWGHQPC